jgi:8-oxo-dGTP diphosphatase
VSEVDWETVPVFGAAFPGGAVQRPSAYALIADRQARLAVILTSTGHYLPGGGIEPGESADQAVLREVVEECGFAVALLDWRRYAMEHVFGPTERTAFAKRCAYVAAERVDDLPAGPVEPDHALLWLPPADAAERLRLPSQRWAVAEWAREQGEVGDA